ncbi:mechanosensitive ion channel family protein [bacterium]|nr:mechanosensitive ion channel family protein [bacterium]
MPKGVLLLLEFVCFGFITFIAFILIDKSCKKLGEKLAIFKNYAHFINLEAFITKFLKIAFVFFAVTAILQKHGYSLTSLIAGFGITGLAVSFAAKETIANIFGSISLMFDKVYTLGDYIKVGEHEGTVEDVNMRSTKIRTLDDVVVNIPNETLATSPVYNYSRIGKRRIKETLGIIYETPNEKITQAQRIIENILDSNENILGDFQVYISLFNSSSIDITFEAYAKFKELSRAKEIKSEILYSILKRFREEEISLAYPTQTLYIQSEK